MRVYTFKADEKLIEMLDDIAKMEKRTRSELIREAIELYIKLKNFSIEAPYRKIRLYS